MEGLIPIKSENDRQLVSARDLYKGLGLKIRFSLWVSKNFDSFEENQDFTSVSTDTVVNNGARKPIKDKAGKDHVKPLTAWTQKGRRLIYDVLKENGILPLIERDDVA